MKGFTEDLQPGTVLNDRYEIVKRIGGGGMGSVYNARDKRLSGRLVAVKEMIQQFSDEGQQKKAVDDFLREAELLASLDHPSIPTIFDYFIENGRYYLVMYFIQGRDLEAEMYRRGGRCDELTMTRWASQVADVLAYIHEMEPPIIYRDMKPANLMLDERRNKIMLIDFGIARFVAPSQKGVTAIGTMGYAPPELFSGKVEPRSDLYSLGATMFHMMTGSDPQDNPLLIFDFTKHPKPIKINPALSPEMDELIVSMVAHKPDDRPVSAAALKKALDDHERRLSNPAAAVPVPAISSALCTACGGGMGAKDAFCPHCGAATGLRGTHALSAKLATLNSPTSHTFSIDKEDNLIGRADPNASIFPEVDLTVHDVQTKVSRRHARIFRQGDTFFIEDLGSANGTSVNGTLQLSPRAPQPLQNGDVVKLGETMLKVSLA